MNAAGDRKVRASPRRTPLAKGQSFGPR